MQQIFFVIILLLTTGLKAQQIAINDRLLVQLTTNHGVRMASEQAFLDSYEKQKEMYDDIKNKTAQVIAIQEYIYQQLKNVNSALSQSKKLVYFYQYMGKLPPIPTRCWTYPPSIPNMPYWSPNTTWKSANRR